ncbi:MAG: efflux RND transporter permease subunit [Microscillaceae bacterium]|nr:efflux RND transporter permease subunit [Microscillaceae bacterium]
MAAGINVDETTKQIIAELKKLPFPPGYGFEVGGELESRMESFGDLFQSLLIAMLAVFSVLVLQFRSFLQPFIIFTSIPLSFIGAIWGLFLSGYSFSFTAFLGAISLVGIVVNDAIILIDLINQYLKEGMEKSEAITKATEHRFVPILLTSLTTIGGLLPLTLRGGLFWAPMGWCIIGGLTTSTLLTLLIVPVLYHFFTRGGKSPKKIAI